MTRQPKKEQTDLIDREVIGRLQTDFLNELNEIFKLKPLRDLANDDDFLIRLAKIIYFHRSLDHKSTRRAILQLIQSTDEAEKKIDLVKHGIKALDIGQFRLTMNLAGHFLPTYFPETLRNADLVEILARFQTILLYLSLALGLSTGVMQRSRRRGRPTSEHVLPAIELIQLWEHAIAEQQRKRSQTCEIKPVPTPKRNEGIIDQPSTEFARIAFQMISPGIKDSEVFTAIKHALQVQTEFYKLLPAKADTAKIMGAIFRMDERANLVRKMARKPII